MKPPAGAPNILLILTDDVGFGASSTFGGPIPTPTFDRLASSGLRFTRFHTTALCSPTRAALLTGRNHHSVGSGVITEIGTGYPGYTSIIPKSAATVGEILRQNGYATSWFGKCHNVPVWETSQAGPFDRWPTGLGFEHFYGFLGGDSSQWDPLLYEGTRPVSKPRGDKDYHFDRDLADRAITWIQNLNAVVARTNRSSLSMRPARPMPRTTLRRSGSPGSKVNLIRAGIRSARRPLRGRRSWEWSPPPRNLRRVPALFRHGARSRRMRRNCMPTWRRSMPPRSRTPTITPAA